MNYEELTYYSKLIVKMMTCEPQLLTVTSTSHIGQS